MHIPQLQAADGRTLRYLPRWRRGGSGLLELVVFDPSILEITRKNYL